MNLLSSIIVCMTIVISKEMKKTKPIRENKKTRIISGIILGVVMLFMVIFLSFNYFKTSIHLDEFTIIEKVHEEKGIYIYTILEEGREKYLVLKQEGILHKLFLQMKMPVQERANIETETFQYKHDIDIENSVITHTYKKRWGDGMVSFWVILAMGAYLAIEQEKLSKADKIIGVLWLIIAVGVTIFFLF